MKKAFFVLFGFTFLLTNIHSENFDVGIQNDEDVNMGIIDLPRNMYVIFNEGIHKHSRPSSDSNRIGSLSYGARIIIYSRSDNTEIINGIEDYWYSTTFFEFRGNKLYDNWVFGGYISERIPFSVPIIFGRWENINFIDEFFEFDFFDNEFAHGIKETGMFVRGTWVLNNNIITINLTSGGEGIGIINEIVDLRLIVIHTNKIILIYPNNRIVELRRINDLWY